MNKRNSFTFQKVAPSHLELPTVIAFSMGDPTPEKVQKVLGFYNNAPDHHLIGCFEANKLIGVIGLETQDKNGIIRHIAVLSQNRLQGVGKALIRHAIDQFLLQIIYAETDDDAVDFYRKVGFICQPLEGHHGKRYKCEYKL